MKAIVDYTDDEQAKMREKAAALQKAISGLNRDELITYTERYGCVKYDFRGTYTRYDFRGTYTDKLVEALGRHPSDEEIIMLVDSGYSHFGAGCSINRGAKTFSGYVYID